MTTATLQLSTPISTSQAVPRKGFLARFYDAVVEARMRAAMRELAMHRHLIPEDMLKKAGYAATASHDGTYPFTR